VACNIPLESSRQGLQLFFRLHLNRRSTQKVMRPQNRESPNFGSPETKCHLDAGPVARHRIYYKGEGGGFPQVRAMVNLVNPSCPWLVLTPKMFQLCTNQLVFGFVHVCVSSWCLSFFLVPSQSSSTPLYPRSVASQGTCPNSLFFRCFQFRLMFESIKELGSMSLTLEQLLLQFILYMKHHNVVMFDAFMWN
jgi:hypothetical protein